MIELLVVIAVFGLLSVILAAGFRFAREAITRGMNRVDQASALNLTANFLRARFADVRALPDQTRPGAVLFDGATDSVQFVGAPPAYRALGGLHLERVVVTEFHGKRDLIFQSSPIGSTAQSPASVLFEGIGTAQFGYFGRLTENEAPTWHDRWSDAAGLPVLIRLRLGFQDGRQAPDLVVAVRPAEAVFR